MITTIIIVIILIVIVVWAVSIYNKFVSNRNTVLDAFSNIDVMLTKRHNLIPNLINTVEGYVEHERGTLEAVVKARQQAINIKSDDVNEKIAAENALQQTLRSLFALSENYPDLKADSLFINLQEQLTELETGIERSRRYFNATVRENNTYGESLPGVLFASWGYRRFDFFEAAETSRELPEVDFSDPSNDQA